MGIKDCHNTADFRQLAKKRLPAPLFHYIDGGADDEVTLRNFVKKVNPGGPGWTKYSDGISSEPWPVPNGILCMVLGCVAVYGFLLGVGQLIYGQTGLGIIICGLGTVSSFGLYKLWK